MPELALVVFGIMLFLILTSWFWSLVKGAASL